MQKMLFVCLTSSAMLLFGCHANKPVRESLVFHFTGPNNLCDGGFACYPSKYGGWLCEAGLDDGCRKQALHIEAETNSLREVFELVKEAEAAVDAREQIERYDAAERDVEPPCSSPHPPDSWKLEITYIRNRGEADVRIISGTKVDRVLAENPVVRRLYREAILPLHLTKSCWFRNLTPTPEELEGMDRQRLKQPE